MIKKPAIPPFSSADRTLTLAINSLKENVEIMNGSRPGTTEIAQLASTASNAEIIAKINQIIAALNFSGQ